MPSIRYFGNEWTFSSIFLGATRFTEFLIDVRVTVCKNFRGATARASSALHEPRPRYSCVSQDIVRPCVVKVGQYEACLGSWGCLGMHCAARAGCLGLLGQLGLDAHAFASCSYGWGHMPASCGWGCVLMLSVVQLGLGDHACVVQLRLGAHAFASCS